MEHFPCSPGVRAESLCSSGPSVAYVVFPCFPSVCEVFPYSPAISVESPCPLTVCVECPCSLGV